MDPEIPFSLRRVLQKPITRVQRVERVLQSITHHRINAGFILRQWLVGEQLHIERLRHPEDADLAWLKALAVCFRDKPPYGDIPWDEQRLAEALAFYEAFPDINTLTSRAHYLLTWRHYQTLLDIKDPEYREWLVGRATQSELRGRVPSFEEWRERIDDGSYEEERAAEAAGCLAGSQDDRFMAMASPPMTEQEIARETLRTHNQRAVLEMKEEVGLWQYLEGAIKDYRLSPEDLQLGAEPEVRQFLDFSREGGMSSFLLGQVAARKSYAISKLLQRSSSLALLALDRVMAIDGVSRSADVVFYHVGLHCRVVVNFAEEESLSLFGHLNEHWAVDPAAPLTPGMYEVRELVRRLDDEAEAAGQQGDLPTIGFLVTWESDGENTVFKMATLLASGVVAQKDIPQYQPLFEAVNDWAEEEVRCSALFDRSTLGDELPY